MSIGIVAGSFDPITNGHVWLIRKAAEMIGDGKLYVVIGVNSAKKYYFSAEERATQITRVLEETLPSSLFKAVEIVDVKNDFLINFAKSVRASYIFRGIRNSEDFNYEAQILQVNRKICAKIETVFFMPPFEMSEVSSSTVRGLVGFNDWEQIVEQYVHSSVIDDFKKKLNSVTS